MWKLPDWYGSSLVALLFGTLLCLWSDDPSYSYLFGFCLNINALVLLLAWEYTHLNSNISVDARTKTTVAVGDDTRTRRTQQQRDDRAVPLLEVEAKIKLPVLTGDTSADNHDSHPPSTNNLIIDQQGENVNNNNSKDDRDDQQMQMQLQVPSLQVSSLSGDSYDDDFDDDHRHQQLPNDPTSGDAAAGGFLSRLTVLLSLDRQKSMANIQHDNDGEENNIEGGEEEDDDGDDDDDDDELSIDIETSFFCWGGVCPYVCFFLMVLFVSGITFLQKCFATSLDYEDESNYFFFGNNNNSSSSSSSNNNNSMIRIQMAAFLISFGSYLAACLLSWGKSSFVSNFFTRVILRILPNNSNDTHDHHDNHDHDNHDNQDQANKKKSSAAAAATAGLLLLLKFVAIGVAFLLARMSWVLVGKEFANERTWSNEQILTSSTNNNNNNNNNNGAGGGYYNWTSMYMGAAWTLGDATVLLGSSDNGSGGGGEEEFCQSKSGAGVIPVSVSVSWGGDWACPSNPDVYCETTVETRVSCIHWNRFRSTTASVTRHGQTDDQQEEVAETDDDATNNDGDAVVTLEEYVQFRYHDYGMDDDAAYDHQAEPSYHYWNRPTELIVGTCDGTCVAQSQAWLSHVQDKVTLSSHLGYAAIGMGVMFSAWPIYELWRFAKEHQTTRITFCSKSGHDDDDDDCDVLAETDYQREESSHGMII